MRIKGRAPAAHPWIWRSRIDTAPLNLTPGAVVEVVDGDGDRIGRALFHPHVTMALRILTRDSDEAIDLGFFSRRFQSALALRHDLLRLPEVTDRVLQMERGIRRESIRKDESAGVVSEVREQVLLVERDEIPEDALSERL